MNTFLFENIIFGPIQSRRLGKSLGINLLPTKRKICNFNCIYCECGWTNNKHGFNSFPDPSQIKIELINKICRLKKKSLNLDFISFTGNGEPTLHPTFDKVMFDVIAIRDILIPNCKIAVFTNATMLHKQKVRSALSKSDLCMYKLDAGDKTLFKMINQPTGAINYNKIIKYLSANNEPVILQSMFFKGIYNGNKINNTNSASVDLWIEKVLDIMPKSVLLYTLDRNTPAKNLKRASRVELLNIKKRLIQHNISAKVI